MQAVEEDAGSEIAPDAFYVRIKLILGGIPGGGERVCACPLSSSVFAGLSAHSFLSCSSQR